MSLLKSVDLALRASWKGKWEDVIALCQLQEGIQDRVRNSAGLSEPRHVSNGVKHGCVPGPILFNLVYVALVKKAAGNNLASVSYDSVPMKHSILHSCEQ